MRIPATLLFIPLFLISFALHCEAQPFDIGITDLLPNVDNGNAGLILAQQTTLAQPAALQSISFYIVQNIGTIRLGLYDSDGANGNPGNKLAETAEITAIVGWNTVPVAQVNLAAGTYWLAYEVSSRSSEYLTSYNVGPIVYAALQYGALPVTFPNSPTESAGAWSFYATLSLSPSAPTATPTPIPTPTPTPAETPIPTPGTIRIGITQVLTTLDSGNANLLLAQSADLSQAAMIQSLSFYAQSAAGSLRLGIYSNSGAVPGAIMGSTNPFTVGPGWNTANVVSPVVLQPGTYWLAYLPSSNDLQFEKASIGGGSVLTNFTDAPMPASFPASISTTPSQWSFYATLIPFVAPSPTPTTSATPNPTPTATPTPTPATGVAYPLKVSDSHRYLVDQNSVPFMVVGDSAWNLIANLTEAQAATYFADRKAIGFNTVLFSLFAGSAIFGRSDFSTYDGIIPFTTPGDISTPNPAYFQRVDDMINLAASYGLCVFLDPIENYGWEATFESSGVTKCAAFGTYLGNRYKNFPNLVWSNGNDYQDWPAADSVFLAIVNAIKAVDSSHIQTLELDYNNSMAFDDSNWVAPVLGLNWSYTYFPAYAEGLHCYAASPTTPYILGESIYEQESHGTTDSGTVENVRRQEWWTACSGAAGQLYGSAWTDAFPSGWQNNLDTPGAIQLGFLATTLRPLAWYNLVPDTTHVFVTGGYGTQYTYPGNPSGDSTGTLAVNTFVTAAITPDGTLAIAYLPTTTTITVNLSQFSGSIAAKWIDPSTGKASTIAGSPFAAVGSQQFTSPGRTSDDQKDWVLLLTVTQ